VILVQTEYTPKSQFIFSLNQNQNDIFMVFLSIFISTVYLARDFLEVYGIISDYAANTCNAMEHRLIMISTATFFSFDS
jgi:hypothetical protein